MSSYRADGDVPAELGRDVLDKIREVRRLLSEIHVALGLPPLGPGGLPTIPPGALPGVPIPADEIDAVRDAFGDDIVPRELSLEPGIRIAGVETTQSTQFFDLNNQSSGAAPNNSVPLVANKDLIVRVYVEARAGRYVDYVPGQVTGRIRIGTAEIQPLNGPIAPRPLAALSRANLGHTLNFRVPASQCHGTRRLSVRVFDATPLRPAPNAGNFYRLALMRFASASTTLALTFRDVPPIRITGVLIRFTGDSLDLPRPVAGAVMDTLARFSPMLPIPSFSFLPCLPLDYGESLTALEGWSTLVNRIADLRSASTERAIYVGVLPPNVSAQVGTTRRGRGRPGIAVAAQDDTRAMSHEIGHATQLGHVDAGGAEKPFDDEYPQYAAFPFGSIGEHGVDSARLTIFNPATAQDLMTYSDSGNVLLPVATWISPYHYQKMLNAVVLSDGTGDYPIEITVVLVFNFRVRRDDVVELLPSYRVGGVAALDSARPHRPISIELTDRNGTLLATYRCHEHNPYQDADGPYVDFHEVIPWPAEVAKLAVVKNGRVLQTFDAAAPAPRVRLGELSRSRRGAELARLVWDVENTHGATHALVRYSNDDGRSWQAIATSLTARELLVDLSTLPGGERCRLEVTVSSGLASESAQTPAFAVARKPRKVYLASPHRGSTWVVGETVRLVGGGYSPDEGTCADDAVVWHSSLDGLIGTGTQVACNHLRVGTHRITLTLADADDAADATASTWIKVVSDRDAECHDDPAG